MATALAYRLSSVLRAHLGDRNTVVGITRLKSLVLSLISFSRNCRRIKQNLDIVLVEIYGPTILYDHQKAFAPAELHSIVMQMDPKSDVLAAWDSIQRECVEEVTEVLASDDEIEVVEPSTKRQSVENLQIVASQPKLSHNRFELVAVRDQHDGVCTHCGELQRRLRLLEAKCKRGQVVNLKHWKKTQAARAHQEEE